MTTATSQVLTDAVEFWPPAVAPARYGLIPTVSWWPDARVSAEEGAELLEAPNALYRVVQPDYHNIPELVELAAGRARYDDRTSASRFLIAGVRFRNWNYGASTSSGQWDHPWCELPPPEEMKEGVRPLVPTDYDPVVCWAFDMCDLTAYSHAEVKRNAQQWLRLTTPTTLETTLATRMLSDAGVLPSAISFTQALGQLEGAIGATQTVGYIHASTTLAAAAAATQNIVHNPVTGRLETNLGNVWVFGGGYISALGNKLVATSKLYGWKSEPDLRVTIEGRFNQFVAVAEQNFLVGYEELIGAAVYSPS